ncbi:GmrSD restriction endonuclease domain-containing protein [Streptomyces sp. NPDC005071]
MAQLEAREVPLRKVLSSDYDFRIPDYQRPYARRTDQAGQLLADLEEALLRGNGKPYFLGSLVLVKDCRAARPTTTLDTSPNRRLEPTHRASTDPGALHNGCMWSAVVPGPRRQIEHMGPPSGMRARLCLYSAA